MYNIDACGLSCPEPIILLKQAIKENNDQIVLLVDNKTSVETCTRFAESQGFNVNLQSKGKIHELTIKK